MTRLLQVPAVASLAILCAAASIQAATVPADAFAKLRRTASYQRAIDAAARQTVGLVACAKTTRTMTVTRNEKTPPVVDAKGVVRSGSWIERIVTTGCGTMRVLNVAVGVERAGAMHAMPLLPGTTETKDPTLERDGVRYAIAALKPDGTDCRPFVADTAYVGALAKAELTDVTAKSGWSERWTIARCDQKISMIMHFMPNPTGTTIRVFNDSAPR